MNFSQDMLQMVPVGLLVAVVVICLGLAWSIGARTRARTDRPHPERAEAWAEGERQAPLKTTTIATDTRDRVRSFINELKTFER